MIRAYERIRYILSRKYKDVELPNILFLHGNIGIRVCKEHGRVLPEGYFCPECEKLPGKVELLYPVTKKNYQDGDFIEDQWNSLKRYLNGDSAYFTIFGYGAPKTDVEARELLKNNWNKNKLNNFNQIEIIDIEEEDVLEKKWEPFFFSHHYDIVNSINDSILFKFPRRSCEALILRTMFLKYLKEFSLKPISEYNSIFELTASMIPLFEEEKKMRINPDFNIMKPMILEI